MKAALFWRREADGAVRCLLCPHACRIPEGARGRCFGRLNVGGALVAETWGRPAATCVDPIEKKPLFHFLPGSRILSLGTLGCNLSCRFCQNWPLSHPEGGWGLPDETTSPEDVARTAARNGLPAVAVTYNEPAVWAEYAMDVADACRERGVRTVAVTAGYFAPEPRAEFFRRMDAANVDLKSFRDEFYREHCGARLGPVLETLEHIRRDTSCWLEVTTLVVPGLNDSEKELDELTAWVAGRLGPETPLHFSAFHPDGALRGVPPTPPATLCRARDAAHANGLKHVYVGNVRGAPEWTATHCAQCGGLLVDREGFSALKLELGADGRCNLCGAACAGVFV